MDSDYVLVILHMMEETPNSKAFIKPYKLKGVYRLVRHTKAKRFHFYVKDEGVPAMQLKLPCITPNWAPKDGLFIWCKDIDGKCMLPDGAPKSCTTNPMRSGLEIIKGIYGFIKYWKELYEADITKRVQDTYEPLIAYWNCI